MARLDKFLSLRPYGLPCEEKRDLLLSELAYLNHHHYENCSSYRSILNRLYPGWKNAERLEELPFIPVGLFKQIELMSINGTGISKKMTSSGTSGQRPSQVFLDAKTAANQARVLTKILSDFAGPKRLPMIVLDCEKVVENRKEFSARAVGILGFSIIGKTVLFALDDKMDFRFEEVRAFCDKIQDEPIVLFGFTFIVWKHLYRFLSERGLTLSLSNGILFHGGGWKRMSDEAVDNETFKRALESVCSIKRVHNYYGLVEQAGSIFVECQKGFLHCSVCSDVLTRDASFKVTPLGKPGLLQLFSLLPESYPGHSILTEDLGQIYGEDDCKCGRQGKYFRVIGRAPQAEMRGCSDAIAA